MASFAYWHRHSPPKTPAPKTDGAAKSAASSSEDRHQRQNGGRESRDSSVSSGTPLPLPLDGGQEGDYQRRQARPQRGEVLRR